MMNELVHTHMTKQVVTVGPDATLGQVREILISQKIHHLPVVESNNQLKGLVTSWDIFKLGKSAEECKNIAVKDVMTTKLATLSPDDHLGAVAEVLMKHLFHAVPIVNDQHQLMGIVTSYDLLKYEFAKEYPDNLDKFVPENM